ncbi:MAG: hypothetical protein ACR2PZ_17650 [Pseudomonadales bacterium]
MTVPSAKAEIAPATSAPVLLALQLTLLDLLLQPVGPWWMRWAVLLLAAAGLVWRRALAHPALWFCLALLTAARVIADWPLSDNHAYLLSYWCLACGLAVLSDNPQPSLARNARWLIGLVFAWATFWKLAPSSDYASGLFFRVTMLTDPRFESFAQIVGGLSGSQFEGLREFVSAHADGGMPVTIDVPPEPRQFVMLAQLASWWNIFLNAAIAVAFLSPPGYWLSRYRNALLLTFCVVTYAIATVAGFGWLLIAMAVSQTNPEYTRLRTVYVAVFGLILLYREIPWADAVVLPLFDSMAVLL